MSQFTFSATFFKATTTIDGGWRITFDVNPSEADQIHQLANCKDKELQLGIVVINPDKFYNLK